MEASGTLIVDDLEVAVTHLDKILWPQKGIRKVDYLHYLQSISMYILPFLRDRALTTIRFPNGITNESFYQKNCPAYAPNFVETIKQDNIEYIMCQNLATLLWLGNQGSIEFHIPFTKKDESVPLEIVIDLDPPSQQEFSLALEAVFLLKDVCAKLQIISFVKTSGNKGMQLLIPLGAAKVNFQQCRLFSKFIADYLINKEPRWFTTERMKGKRENKLYIDYVQHWKYKTIIAPYSVRANEQALVSAPLYWDEVTANLHPTQFPLEVIPKRLADKGCPLATYSEVHNEHIPIIIEELQAKVN